jgi:hypothetical protein
MYFLQTLLNLDKTISHGNYYLLLMTKKAISFRADFYLNNNYLIPSVKFI